MGLSVNTNKSDVVDFIRKYKCDASYKLILNGQVLKLSNEMNYLEVHFDSKMSWKIQLEVKYRKCNMALDKSEGL